VARTVAQPRRVFAGVSFAALAGFISLGAVVPALPRLVTGPLDGGDVEVGIAVGAFGLGAITSRPFLGRIIDTVGRRPVMLAGLLTIATAGLLYAPVDSMGALVAVRILHGVGQAAVYTAGATWAVDLAPADRRGQAIGLYGLGVWGGQAIGPLLGEGAYRLGGLDAVWIVVTVMPLIGAATVCMLRADRPPARRRGPRSLIPAAARGPGLALALASVGVAAVTGFALLLAEDRDISGGALVWPAFGAGLVLARLCFGKLPDTMGARRCATASCLAQGAGILCLAVATNLPVALAGAALAGAGSALIFPALALLVVGRTPDDQRGAAIGAFTACFDLGFALGGVTLGIVAEAAGYGLAFTVAAAACAVGALVAQRAARGTAGGVPRPS
jgi:MFS family permease